MPLLTSNVGPKKMMPRIISILVLICGASVFAQEEAVMDDEEYLFGMVEAIQDKESTIGLTRMPTNQQVFFLVWSLEAEVNNGGFDQYYFNSAGDNAAAAVEALRNIGALQMAAIVEQANNIFGTMGPSQNRDQRQEQLLSLSQVQQEQLSTLDSRFYTYPDNLSELLANYMRGSE